MVTAIADTHAVFWYLYGDNRLSSRARAFIDATARAGDRIGVSAISVAEILYLAEKGRIDAGAYSTVVRLLADSRQVFECIPLALDVVTRLTEVPRASVPDLPDRIITATALALKVSAISKDGRIRSSVVPTIW